MSKTNNALFVSFLICIFLIKAPSLIFLFDNKLFTTHTLAKLVIIILFFLLIRSNKKKIINLLKKKIFLIIFFFVMGISISILSAKDIIKYWQSYHNILIGLMIFINSFLIAKSFKFKKIFNFLLFSSFFFVILELVLFLLKEKVVLLSNLFLQKEFFDFFMTKLSMGRFSVNNNLEIFFPVIFFQYLFSRKKNNYFSLIALIILIYITNLANMRSRIICLLFAIFASYLLYGKKSLIIKKRIILVIITTIFSTIIGIISSFLLFRYTIVNRFLLNENTSDYETIVSRIDFTKESIKYFQSSPLIGVGLGNYIYEKKNNSRYSVSYSKSEKNFIELVRYSPHNIFLSFLSETGLFGLTPFLIIIFYFIIIDLRSFFSLDDKKRKKLTIAISSWTLFIYMLFNPSQTIFISGWFWFLRGVVEGI